MIVGYIIFLSMQKKKPAGKGGAAGKAAGIPLVGPGLKLAMAGFQENVAAVKKVVGNLASGDIGGALGEGVKGAIGASPVGFVLRLAGVNTDSVATGVESAADTVADGTVDAAKAVGGGFKDAGEAVGGGFEDAGEAMCFWC